MSKIVIMESLGISAEELAARKASFEAQGHVFVDYPENHRSCQTDRRSQGCRRHDPCQYADAGRCPAQV